ncbi:MAG TPA: hypothetical protein VGE77_00130 [Nocardioides sp.]
MQPRLIPVHEPDRPTAAVLVLHGGGSRPGSPMVSPAQLSVLRMKPVARRLARRVGRAATYRLLNTRRAASTRCCGTDAGSRSGRRRSSTTTCPEPRAAGA